MKEKSPKTLYSITLTTLCVLGVFFGSFPPSAFAATVEDATVNLYCTIKSGNKIFSSSGSGVFISERGVILTNAHVAQYFLLQDGEKKQKSTCTVRAGSPAKNKYNASVLYISPTWLEQSVAKEKGTGEHDFALLYVTDTKDKVLPTIFPALKPEFVSDPLESDPVTIAGYPTEKMNFNQVEKKLAFVAASSSVTQLHTFNKGNKLVDLVTLAPSAAGSYGVSGGPVVNAENEVIGIATTKNTAKNNRTLRAITFPYINRQVFMETYTTLGLMLASDYTSRASTTKALISEKTLTTLSKSIFKKN